jgi:hypothetical protein
MPGSDLAGHPDAGLARHGSPPSGMPPPRRSTACPRAPCSPSWRVPTQRPWFTRPRRALARADARTRAEARRALGGLATGGGTATGQWLRLAHRIFASAPAMLRHAILLTSSKNQHETPDEPDAAISLCEGAFRCDCRGLGTDWELAGLRKISTTPLGSIDIVVDPAGLAADFEAMVSDAMSKLVPGVSRPATTPRVPGRRGKAATTTSACGSPLLRRFLCDRLPGLGHNPRRQTSPGSVHAANFRAAAA